MMQFATLKEWPGGEMMEEVSKVGGVAICRVCRFSFAWRALAVWGVLFGGSVPLVQAGQQVATIRHIRVNGDDHDLDVEITATKPISPQTQIVTNPDRLVVDLPEARPDRGLQKIAINRGKLKDVRVGLLRANPPITRVVLDLMAPTEYRVSPRANTIVVKLGKEPAPAATPTATTEPSADARPAETTSAVSTPPPAQSSEPSRARWILPILLMTTILAMIVIAVVAHLQNKRGSGGL
jgi:AMIN domain